MKKQHKNLILSFVAIVALSAGGLFLGSCDSTANKQTNESHQMQQTDHQDMAEMVYACPMKCEGDKTYPEPGKCPECGMALKAVPDHDHAGHNH